MSERLLRELKALDMTPKERAYKKADLEISKGIERIQKLSSVSGIGELAFFLSYLHGARVLRLFPNEKKEKEAKINILSSQLIDAIKYAIQMIYKFGAKKFERDRVSNSLIKGDVCQLILKISLHINRNLESRNLLDLFDSVEVSGERDQDIQLHLVDLERPEIKVFTNYILRVHNDNEIKKRNVMDLDSLIKNFKSEYEQFDDLFQRAFKVSVNDFTNLVRTIVDIIKNQIKSNESNFTLLPNGNIDVKAYDTILFYGKSLFIQKKDLFEKIDIKFQSILRMLSFNGFKFDPNELQYFHLTRQPILDFGTKYIVSPELLLDSLFTNTHYSLLEESDLKEEYKSRYSEKFLDEIVKVGSITGFKEYGRNIDIIEGKRNLGDLDLVLFDSKENFYLIIEAKSHTIPLDIYFGRIEPIKKRLDYLQKQWDSKVEVREEWLRNNRESVGIGENFEYIIISKFPEILSHFTDRLVLSIAEFKDWITDFYNLKSFKEVNEAIQKKFESDLTHEEMEEINRSIMASWKFK